MVCGALMSSRLMIYASIVVRARPLEPGNRDAVIGRRRHCVMSFGCGGPSASLTKIRDRGASISVGIRLGVALHGVAIRP